MRPLVASTASTCRALGFFADVADLHADPAAIGLDLGLNPGQLVDRSADDGHTRPQRGQLMGPRSGRCRWPPPVTMTVLPKKYPGRKADSYRMPIP